MTTLQFGFGNRPSKVKSRVAKLIASAAVLCSLSAIATARAPRANAQDPKFEMGTFYLCLLINPPNFTVGQAPQQLLQSHFKHVQGLIASGKAAIAGPFGDDTRIAGVFVLNASSPEEARALEEADPLVKEGGFSVEVLKWWAAKGIMKPPAQPIKQAT